MRYRAMKTTALIILLIVGFILLAGTESEYGQSNIIGLCLFAFSGWKLGLFEEEATP